MTVKEFANKFDMSVGELSEYTGYTRQALHNIISKDCEVSRGRFKAMIASLKRKAWSDMCQKQADIQEKYDAQLEALKELETRERAFGYFEANKVVQ